VTPQENTKNIVIFSDGTGNQLKAKGNTSVLRLHSMTRETATQIRFYDPGVGTEGSSRALTGSAEELPSCWGWFSATEPSGTL
jgi:uncharacterized protein (DUF2235 family)